MSSSRKTPLTPDQVRAQFKQRGKTLTAWAAENGYDRREVYNVLTGVTKGYYGRAHEIAVALGLKVPDAQPSSPSAGGNTHLDAAA